LRFSLYRPELFGIPTLPPSGWKKDASTAIENQTFGAGVTKKIFKIKYLNIFF